MESQLVWKVQRQGDCKAKFRYRVIIKFQKHYPHIWFQIKTKA